MKPLNIVQWRYEQSELNRALYAIVDPQSAHQPHVVFYQCDGENGGPLISSDTLTNPENGPWLLPVNERFLAWWQIDEHAESGIIVSTDSNANDLRAYFASLFQASLLGEVVFLPFYNPGYIGGMLPRLRPEEITQLLRNHNVLIRHAQQWQSWQSDGSVNQTLEQVPNAPWWVIKEHHLDTTPNVPLLSRNVESWLWQNHPQLMEARTEHNMPHFPAAFQAHFTALGSVADNQVMTLAERTLAASVATAYDNTALNRISVQQTIAIVRDDELLFGLKTLFNKLQGEA